MMNNLPTKQDLLNKAIKCMIVNKEVAKTIERKTMTRRVADIGDEPYFVDNHKEEIIEKHAKYKVGDIAWLREPTKVIATAESNGKIISALIEYYGDCKRVVWSEIPKDIPRWLEKRQGIPNGCLRTMARYFFEITAKKGINDWDSNPYVFVYEFKLLKYKG